jgi:hypothetical protein
LGLNLNDKNINNWNKEFPEPLTIYAKKFYEENKVDNYEID